PLPFGIAAVSVSVGAVGSQIVLIGGSSGQICTAGARNGLDTPEKLGWATSGGRKKKCVLPPCAPSEVSALSFGRAGRVGLVSVHAINAMVARTGSAVRFIGVLPPKGGRTVTALNQREPCLARRSDQRLEPRVIAQVPPPPMGKARQPDSVLRVGGDLFREQAQGSFAIAEQRLRECLEGQEFPLRIEFGAGLRSREHTPGTVGEPGAPEHGCDGDLRAQS